MANEISAEAKRQLPKIFVLDTNVPLHDSSCIRCFGEHDIVVCMTVLEELDNIKSNKHKYSDELRYHARVFSREVDKLSEGQVFNGGASLGPGLGRLMTRIDQEIDPGIKGVFIDENKPDHRILNVAYRLNKEKRGTHQVILVSKDTNLRMKAKFVGIIAEDFESDHIKDPSKFKRGTRIIENVDIEIVDEIYKSASGVGIEKLSLTPDQVRINESLVIRNGKKSVLVTCLQNFSGNGTKVLRRIDNLNAYGIEPRNAEQRFFMDVLLNDEIKLVAGLGKAGTGKTLLAIASALEVRKEYRQILIARPSVPLSNKDYGYLPGSVSDKISLYMRPIYDSLEVIKDNLGDCSMATAIKSMLEKGFIQVEPLAYIRGRNISRSFLIVDEAQNLTPHEIKTIITRAGGSSKLVFVGDVEQIDHPYLDFESNGLSYLVDKFPESRIFAYVNLLKGERSELANMAALAL
jgi:PhoH-like ATPase